MLTILRDVRYTLRQLRKAPGFALTAILTLALGIGATTAVFTLVHAVLLQSLPVAKPGELWKFGATSHCCEWGGYTQQGFDAPDFSIFSFELYQYLRDNTPGFEQIAAFEGGNTNLGVRESGSNAVPDWLLGQLVSGNFFSTLGVRAFAGRTLLPADDQRAAPPVAMMSYRLWEQKYALRPGIVGSTLLLNGQPFTIVGIAPPGFFGAKLQPMPPDFWMPINSAPLVQGSYSVLDNPNQHWLDIIGRIKPGVIADSLNPRINGELQQWLHSHAADMESGERKEIAKQKTELVPGGAGVQEMQEQYSKGLRLLTAASAFVLLIVCANVANLMLVRGIARRQSIAVQVALGASRIKLVRTVVVESLVLAVLGGAGGVGIAFAGTRMLLRLAFGKTGAVPIQASPSWPVLLFAFAVALGTGLLFAIAPALMSLRANPVETLRGAGRTTGEAGALPQKALVVAQAALSVVLIAGAGLLLSSLHHLQNSDYGYGRQNRINVKLNEISTGIQTAHSGDVASFAEAKQHSAVLLHALEERFRRIPGVESIALALYTPMAGEEWNNGVYLPGRSRPGRGQDSQAMYDRVSIGYFDTIQTPLISGRAFTDQDTQGTRAVAVVNQAFVRKFYPHKNPIGQHFGQYSVAHAEDYEIVGVVGDARYTNDDLHDPVRPMYFLPLTQWTEFEKPDQRTDEIRSHLIEDIALRYHGTPPANLEKQIREALAEVDPNLTVENIDSFDGLVRNEFIQQSLLAKLTTLFGAIALLLAAVGLYGVTAYIVEGRTNEIGLRMALGADRFQVLRMVMRGALMQVAVGLAIGIPATLLLSRAMASQLFGVAGWDPLVLGATVAVLAAAAALAALVPARRASHVNPMVALRAQ